MSSTTQIFVGKDGAAEASGSPTLAKPADYTFENAARQVGIPAPVFNDIELGKPANPAQQQATA